MFVVVDAESGFSDESMRFAEQWEMREWLNEQPEGFTFIVRKEN